MERLRKLAKRWREGDAEAFRGLNEEVSQLSPDEYYHVRLLVAVVKGVGVGGVWVLMC